MASNLTAVISADTTGFKKSIQDAKNVLKEYTNTAKNSSKEIQKNTSVSSEQVAAYKRVVNALEKTASGSLSTARAQKELTNQIRELKIQWANLSDEAKKSDFGKAISGSLNTAKQQLGTLNTQLKQTADVSNTTTASAGKLSNGFGGIMAAAKKLLPVVGAATVAQQGFKAIVNSSQTASDNFGNALYTAKTAAKELSYAITNFDFSAFSNGLSDIIQKGWDAAAAIDQLGNTIMSYDVKTAKANQKLASSRAILYDADSTKEEKEQAKKDMQEAFTELKASASVLVKDYEDVLIKEINARGGQLNGEGALNIIDKWLEVNVTEGREAVKQSAADAYSAYEKELKNLQERYTTFQTTYQGGDVYMTKMLNKTPEYNKELSNLNDKYKDQIAYHILLEKFSDEELKNLGEQRIAMININGQINTYEASMHRLANRKTTSGGSGSSTPANTDNPLEGSVSYINQQISATKKLRDEQVIGTEEWWEQVRALELLNEQLAQAEAKQKRLTSPDLGKLSPMVPIVGKVQGPALKISGKSPWEKYQEDLDNFQKHYESVMNEIAVSQDLIGAIGNVFGSLSGAVGENGQAWMQFGATVAQSVAKMLPQIQSLILANQAASIAGGTASAAAMPFPANVAAIASIVAELIAIFAALPKFASGGIFEGKSSVGDYNLARVNSGEMILNGSQQARLFNMINTGGLYNNNTISGGNVEFKIRGNELVGVLNNYNSKRSKL